MADPKPESMDRTLALEAVRVTEATALSAFRHMGRGDERNADLAAVEAMRAALQTLHMNGTVVIGEGEPGEAPLLFVGDAVGAGGDGPRIDVAVDPLEGATSCAKGGQNAVAVLALAQHGGFLAAPDVYMDKIAVGPNLPSGVVDLDETPAKNLRSLARAKVVDVSDLVVCILDRPRHEDLIARVREAGASVVLISDGDISGIIATTRAVTGVDMYMGIGGAPEGVLAAAALRCTGGQMQGRLVLRNEDDRNRARRRGITDFERKYGLEDLAKGKVTFSATGITDGSLLRGVRRRHTGAATHSIVMRSVSRTVRFIEAEHDARHHIIAGWSSTRDA